MMRDLTIAYVTVDDPLDKRTWSGTNYFLLNALRKRGVTVIPIGPLRPQPLLFLCKVANQVLLKLTGERFNYRDSHLLSKAYARLVKKRMGNVDMIIAPGALGTTALLETSVPIIHISDRCTAGALDYHLILTGLSKASLEQTLALEQKMLTNSDKIVYSSQWAADAAIGSNPTIAARVRVIPFGANLSQPPPAPAHRDFPPKKLKLLMLATKWEEKGGPIAYQALQALKHQGQEAELVVCGTTPPASFNDPDLVRVGFLDKNNSEDMATLVGHLSSADLLVLPTRFEAYGLVFCEAAAFGLPVLASRTGGIPTIVKEGETGFLFDLKDDGEAYAEKIMHLVRDPALWQAMRTNARKRYETKLNWDVFVNELLYLAQEVLPVSKAE